MLTREWSRSGLGIQMEQHTVTHQAVDLKKKHYLEHPVTHQKWDKSVQSCYSYLLWREKQQFILLKTALKVWKKTIFRSFYLLTYVMFLHYLCDHLSSRYFSLFTEILPVNVFVLFFCCFVLREEESTKDWMTPI